jgi:predicted alpha/beta-hydrolase family hydrolase
VLTFNFLYMEARRRSPDRAPLLEATWRGVMDFAIRSGWADEHQLIVGGKSMGGRVASMVVADPRASGTGTASGSGAVSVRARQAGLVLLGYPLHPPGQPDRPRIEHLPRLTTPTLVVQGTRDAFGSIDEVRAAFRVVPAPVEWLVVDGGDHSFGVPKSSGRSADDVQRAIATGVAEWILRRTPGA